MPVLFDAAAAETLIRAAHRAAEALRSQASVRRGIAEHAARGFTGPTALLFERACTAEAQDRALLARVLAELADQVAAVQECADQENQRERRIVAWELRREAVAPRRLKGTAPSLGFGSSRGLVAYDSRPSDTAVAPPLIRASFAVRQRTRVSSTRTHRRNGAVPTRLGTFVARSAVLNGELRREHELVWESWTRFTSTSPWARIETATFLAGFQQLLAENQADLRWIDRVADAFRTAGGGTLAQASLDRIVLARPRTRTDFEVLDRFLGLSSRELVAWLAATPGMAAQLQQMPPARIALWWSALGGGPDAASTSAGGGHSSKQRMLLRQFPEMLSALDGLPVCVRVQANRNRAGDLLGDARTELDRAEREWARGERRGGAAHLEFLRREVRYLERVADGSTQVYLYDRERSRIVEVLGSVDADTERAVIYVPGTFTSLDSFYQGAVQEIGTYLSHALPGTVVFVYKDGLFPGEERASRSLHPARILEANDREVARTAGQQLHRFSLGIRADPRLRDVPHTGVGHSWGLANLTASELAGSQYQTVLSLSGAGMPAEWRPNPTTGYLDFSYPDLLQSAQGRGYVWRGNTPRASPAFANMPLYRGPEDTVLTSSTLRDAGRKLGVLTRNHTLITTAAPSNQQVLEDLRRVLAQ